MIRRGPRLARGAALSGLAALPVPPDSPERVREAAREALSRPEFQAQREPLPARIEAWARQQLERLLESILESAGGGGIRSLLWLLAFVVVVALVGFLFWRVLRRLTPDPGVTAEDLPPRRPARDWLADAEAHERRGAWREAVRCRYRALVADLAARGLVEEVPGTTAGEYRTQVRTSAPAAAGDFGGATDLFELAWYGDLRTGAGQSEEFKRLSERVLVEAGR